MRGVTWYVSRRWNLIPHLVFPCVYFLLCPRPLGGALSDDAVWRLTSIWRLSRTSGLSREQRPRKTKIGTEVARVTRDSDTTFKVKRSKVKVKVIGAGAYCGGLPHNMFNMQLSLSYHHQKGASSLLQCTEVAHVTRLNRFIEKWFWGKIGTI